jgi:4,5-dihydroxyphthalate decarboxylase
MASSALRASFVPGPLTQPILDGRVTLTDAPLQAQPARSVNENSVQMLDLAYDVAEMSLATFTKAREQGVPIVALPLFTGRRFMQQGIVFAAQAGLQSPAELRGRRVVLPQFWMTSSVWHRMTLRQMYGIEQRDVRWITMAPERMGSLGLPPEATRDDSGRNPREVLRAGDADALMGPGAGGGPPRGNSGGDGQDGALVPAFKDLTAAQREYYERTRTFPIAHIIVMKQELAEREPGLVEALCDLFARAKETGLPEALENPEERPIAGLSLPETQQLFGDDPWPYGISASRPVLETFLDNVRDQGLVDRRMAVDELFAAQLPAGLR